MTQYADYLFYAGEYGGTVLTSSNFKLLAVKASAFVDQATLGRAPAVFAAGTDADKIEKIKLATCAVAEVWNEIETAGGVLSSERVGSLSVTYATEHVKSDKERLTDAAKLFLEDTGLMFRGFYADEYGTNNLSEVGDL